MHRKGELLMKKILLVCCAGMSTSMLELKMEKAAGARGLEVQIKALPVLDAENELNDWDVIMLGPQVRNMEKRLRELTSTPIEVINMRDYGMMNGEKVLDVALKIIEKYTIVKLLNNESEDWVIFTFLIYFYHKSTSIKYKY